MAIQNFAEYFGCDDYEIFEQKQQAEGYLAGAAYATKIHNLIIEDFAEKAPAFREGLLQALREQL